MKSNYIGNKRNGFTLIELVVVIAIISIVFSTIYSMNAFGIKTFKKSSDTSQNQNDVRMAAEFITKQLRYAESVQIINNPSPATGKNSLYLENGKILYYNGENNTSIPGVSNVDDYTLAFSKVSDRIIKFTVGKTGTNEYNMESKITVLNISAGSPIKVNSSDDKGVVFVLAKNLSDVEAVAADKAWLDIPNSDCIQSDISLPDSGPNDTSITWSSSNTSIITNNGDVTQPTGSDATVILTATISKGSSTDIKSFTLIVKKSGTPAIISKIDDITATIDLYSTYTMPKQVTATMSDNSKKYFDVTWQGSIDTDSPGSKTCNGTVVYDGKSYNAKLIVNVNNTIVITNISPINVKKRKSLSYTFIAAGGKPDYIFTYTIPTGSSWISGKADGNISGTAPDVKSGDYPINVKVTDSFGNSNSFDVTVHVSNSGK